MGQALDAYRQWAATNWPNQFDDRDAAIVAERQHRRDMRPGPRVGDFIRMPDGTLRRFTYAYQDRIQTTDPKSRGSFYLCRTGGMTYSGSLDPSILLTKIVDTGKTRPGSCWIFHHDHPGAGRGVETTVNCRVFRHVDAS
jgi:hypothetical protein